jgi:hypothetical protein
MSDNQHNHMNPMSGEPVETTGVYKNEWGGLEKLQRGEIFPADVMLGIGGASLQQPSSGTYRSAPRAA